jgi:hypothetical protein
MIKAFFDVPEKFLLCGKQRDIDRMLIFHQPRDCSCLLCEFFQVYETQSIVCGPIPLAMRILIADFAAPVEVVQRLHQIGNKSSVCEIGL